MKDLSREELLIELEYSFDLLQKEIATSHEPSHPLHQAEKARQQIITLIQQPRIEVDND